MARVAPPRGRSIRLGPAIGRREIRFTFAVHSLSSLTAQGNGTSGAPITILFEPGANFTAPAISNGGAIVLANQSFIIVDGGSTVPCGFVNGSNVTCNNGKIQSTANGTGLANQVASIGVEADSANNIEIRNLEIGPLYQAHFHERPHPEPSRPSLRAVQWRE